MLIWSLVLPIFRGLAGGRVSLFQLISTITGVASASVSTRRSAAVAAEFVFTHTCFDRGGPDTYSPGPRGESIFWRCRSLNASRIPA